MMNMVAKNVNLHLCLTSLDRRAWRGDGTGARRGDGKGVRDGHRREI